MIRIFSMFMFVAIIATCVACSGDKKNKNASTNGKNTDKHDHDENDEHHEGERHVLEHPLLPAGQTAGTEDIGDPPIAARQASVAFIIDGSGSMMVTISMIGSLLSA